MTPLPLPPLVAVELVRIIIMFLTMQLMQKTPISSVSTDNVETLDMSVQNWTEAVLSQIRDIADQLRTMDSQLSAIE